MKKPIIYFYALIFAMTLLSCADNDLKDWNNTEYDSKYIQMSLTIPELPTMELPTRDGSGEVLNIVDEAFLKDLKLYILIFDNNGSPEINGLREVAYGSKIHDMSDEVNMMSESAIRKFSVDLDGTSEKAIMHIIATNDDNFADQLEDFQDRSELGIMTGMNGLSTSGNNYAYWKRKDLKYPITPEYKSDIEAQLVNVPLARNFARIKMTANLENGNYESFDHTITTNGEDFTEFHLLGFEVVNIPDHGFVAAYNETTRSFVDFDNDGTPYNYGDLTYTFNYSGVRHPKSVRQHNDEVATSSSESEDSEPSADTSWLASIDWNDKAKYTFERPYSPQHKTCLLVKGYFDDNQDQPRYIKLDLGTIFDDPKDSQTEQPYGIFENCNILRNISYNVTIKAIQSSKVGFDNPYDALIGPPSNNVATAVETKSIRKIYDGKDQMEVNFTTKIIVDNDDGTANPASEILMWRYYEDYKNDPTTPDNDLVKWNYPGLELTSEENGVIVSFGDEETMDFTPEMIIKNLKVDSKSEENWYGVKLNFGVPTDVPKRKTVRLYSPYGLSRDITFIMRKRWEFVDHSKEGDEYIGNIEIYPGFYSNDDKDFSMPLGVTTLEDMRAYMGDRLGLVGSQRDAHLTAMFELPGDLPEEIFPLEFKIGADRQNVENAYEGSAATTQGPSMFEGVNVNRVQFVKTITWDYYHGKLDDGSDGKRLVTIRLQTVTDPQILGHVLYDGTTRIRVANPYFRTGEGHFYRNTHEDVIDPTRTNWHWNFNDTEWTNYVNNWFPLDNWGLDDEGNQIVNKYIFNDLHFKEDFTKDYYSSSDNNRYCMSMPASNDETPCYSFKCDIDPAQYDGTITIEATPHQAKSGSGSDTKWYDMSVYVMLYTDEQVTGASGYKPYVLGHLKCEQDNGNLPIRTLIFNLNTPELNISEGHKITDVYIWTQKILKEDMAPEDQGNYEKQFGTRTKFYSIDLTLKKR